MLFIQCEQYKAKKAFIYIKSNGHFSAKNFACSHKSTINIKRTQQHIVKYNLYETVFHVNNNWLTNIATFFSNLKSNAPCTVLTFMCAKDDNVSHIYVNLIQRVEIQRANVPTSWTYVQRKLTFFGLPIFFLEKKYIILVFIANFDLYECAWSV
jgi:hypothetical protein